MTPLGTLTEGWIEGIRRIASPNHDERPLGENVCLAVIHAISLPPAQFGGPDIARLFTNSLDPAAHPYFAGIYTLRVSAHFLIRRDGAIIQFVSCDRRAWHAGTSHWNGRERCNDFSIGIELEGCDELPFEAPQYEQLRWLLRTLCRAYPIAFLAGHSDIAPTRKTDPGPCFAWEQLAINDIPPRILQPDLAHVAELRQPL